MKWEIEQPDSGQTMREEKRGTPKEEAVSRPSDTNLCLLGYNGEQNVCHITRAYTGSFLQTLAVHLGLCYSFFSLFTTYIHSHTSIFSISASLLAKVLSSSALGALTPPTVLSRALLGTTASECDAQPQLYPQEDPQAPFL